MATKVGTGQTVSTDARKAGSDAALMARDELHGARPTFGFLFAAPSLDLAACLSAAREVAGADLIGCTTAGEFTERGLTHGGVVVMLVAAESSLHATASAAGMRADVHAVGARLCDSFKARAGEARRKGMAFSTTVALMDGLAGTGEVLIGEIAGGTQAIQQVVGGAAGDEGAFSATRVGGAGAAVGEPAGTDQAAVVHVFGRSPWGIGIGHGLEATTDRMRVTRASGNVVYEIDGKPAFRVYEEHARKRGITLTASFAGDYLIGNEIGILLGDRVTRARAPLSVGADGSLTCAAAIRQGASVAILDGKPASMLAAAQQAATEARDNLEGTKAAGVLIFDCICRGMILKDQFMNEVAAIREVFGQVPIAGFLTYGEIANYKGTLDGWHNSTAVVVAIPQ